MPFSNCRHTNILRWVVACVAIAATTHAESLDFSRQVLPILSDKCFLCHGPDSQEKDPLRLDSYDGATLDRDGIRGINPEDLSASEIIARIHDHDDPMPPEKAEQKLSEAERAILTRWVKEGGAYAEHWAFIPPKKAKPPRRMTRPRNPIDAFVVRALKEQDLKLAKATDKATLARRAALTLTGLPLSPEQLRTHMQNHRRDAYERLVDELLDSPPYAEHQARYWLDAVRYGDTHGLHLDNRRGIYPYRDWIVHAFDQNLPLNDFITWQLAGDLLPAPTIEQQVATGFVRMNPSTAEGGAIKEEFQAKNTFDRTENLGTVLLGMTMTCARCHTHKYDPISHTEYFELFAFFNNTEEKPLDGNSYEYKPIVRAPENRAAWQAWAKHETQSLDLLQSVSTTSLTNALNTIDRLNALAKDTQVTSNQNAHASDLIGQYDSMQKTWTTTLVAKELPTPRVTKLLHRGEYDQPVGEPIQPNVMRVLGAFPDDDARNRLGLAQWLTARENPLVARVLINRVWQRTFGAGLVRTPGDFGLQGEQPTHPELLDWLAVELQDSGWDLKHMLRLMVTSATFRQTSAWRSDLDDPDNIWIARGPGYRLDAEVIRDTALFASDLLDRNDGGEGVRPYQPPGLWSELMHPASNTKNYQADTGSKTYRRSLYVYWKRTSPHPMMSLFDAPSRESSCVRRSRSSTPLQSLALFNENQRMEMARGLGTRLLSASANDTERLDQMFTLLAARVPTKSETTACATLLDTIRNRYKESPDDAAALLGDAATGDTSIDPIELAAWTQLAATVLASDIAILMY
jgi:hypothetical protein